MVLDAKLLIENLKKIPEEENMVPKEKERLKVLLLVLAGDQRVIRGLSLDDMEDLFSETAMLLNGYREGMPDYFNEDRLENYKYAERRAV